MLLHPEQPAGQLQIRRLRKRLMPTTERPQAKGTTAQAGPAEGQAAIFNKPSCVCRQQRSPICKKAMLS